MRARLHLIGSALIGAAVALAFSLSAGSAQEFTFKLHHILGAKSPAQVNMIEPWVKAVEEGSGGRIKIEIYPSMSLGGTPPQLIRQVRDRVVDLVWTVNGYTPELFPRTEVFELPGVFNGNITAANLAMRDLFDAYLAEEYKGLKVIVLHVHGGQGLQMKEKLVRKPADLAGLRMRVPTRTGAWIIEALGATPVNTSVGDIPQALSTGLIDGAFIPWEIIPPFKIQQLTKYQIEGPANERFGTTTFQISMNIDSYNSLPDDLKAVIDKNSGEEYARLVGTAWRKSEEGGIKVALGDKDDTIPNELVVLTEAEMQAFRDAMAPVNQRWIDEVTKAGIDGKALYDAARAAVAAHKDAM
jgi:TRAP-type C4-dicarboxylate transport system substrate-binding protein